MSPLILIVDDNLTNLKLAADVLEFDGFRVGRAESAEHALRYLDDSMPDLILMDIAMPGMDGLTLTRKLKLDERLKHIPIVALTASAMKGDSKVAYEAGCKGYIIKPINTHEFPQQVRDFLEISE